MIKTYYNLSRKEKVAEIPFWLLMILFIATGMGLLSMIAGIFLSDPCICP